MSYSMLGGQGMGSAGMGAGAGPAAPSALSPQVMAMLRMMAGGQGGTGGTGFTPPGAPAQASMAGSPMAGMIGAQAGANPMQHPMMPQQPVGQPPGMMGAGLPSQTPANPLAGATQQLQQYQQIQALMNQLKGGQTGVAPQLNPAQNPNSTMMAGSPGWLQSLYGMMGQGGMPAGAGPAGGET